MQKCDDNTEFEEKNILEVNLDNSVLFSSYTVARVRPILYSITL